MPSFDWTTDAENYINKKEIINIRTKCQKKNKKKTKINEFIIYISVLTKFSITTIIIIINKTFRFYKKGKKNKNIMVEIKKKEIYLANK
jgi:hypothetical protein